MAAYVFHVYRGEGLSSSISLSSGQTVHLKALGDMQYQLLAENGSLIKNPKFVIKGNDLWVLEEGISEPLLIIEDHAITAYQGGFISDAAQLTVFETANQSFAALPETVSQAALQASQVQTSGILLPSVAIATAVGAIGLSAAGGSDKDDADTKAHTPANPSTPSTPSTPTPISAEISLNPIAVINKEAVKTKIEISGNLTLSANADSAEVSVRVNGKDYAAQISGKTWKASIAGSELAYAEGKNAITATVIVKDSAGKSLTKHVNGSYEVDTQIAKPEISFEKVTGDDIINSLEAKEKTTKITGTVKNVNDGEVITLTVGNAKATGAVTGGKFAIAVDTVALVNHKTVIASITTTDTAGNSETGTKNHSVTVSDAPNIAIDNITPDNIVNIEEAGRLVPVSGMVGTDFVGKTITVSCGCPSCTGKGWEDILTTVKDDGSFEVNFDGKTIADNTTIKVTVNDNGAQVSNQKDYEKDLTAPNHSIAIDKIAKDDIINSEEAKLAKTGISAKISGVASDEQVIDAYLTIKGQKIGAIIKNGVLSADVDTALLTSAKEVSISVKVVDKAGNSTLKTATRPYSVDTEMTASVSVDPVNNGKVINSAAKNGAMLTGKLDFAADADLSSIKVLVNVNGKNHNAIVDTAAKTWRLALSDKLIEGGNSATATISASDKAGNKISQTSAVRTYTVDTLASVKVELNKITGDNIIQNSEKSGETTITGKVTGDFKTSDKVIITAGNLKFEVNPNAQGEFSQKVVVAELLKQNSLSVKAEIATTDSAGNPAKGEAVQMYTIEANATDNTKIEITRIANDNLLNVTEAKKQVEVIGAVSGDNIKQGDIVTINVGGKTFNGTVDDKLNFRVLVDGEALKNNAGYKVTASIAGISSKEASYRVDSDVAASIKIKSIAKDNIVGADDGEQMIRISGRVNLTGEWKQGQNAKYVRSVSTDIGGKIYKAGVDEDDQSFFFDIPAKELYAVNGSKLSFTIEHEKKLLKLNQIRDTYWAKEIEASALTNSNITLDKNSHIVDNAGSYTIQSSALKDSGKINIAGAVEGSAKEGDIVTLKAGNVTIGTGKVNANKDFDILVEKSAIVHKQTITAELSSTDLAGNVIKVSDLALTSVAQEGSAVMVNQHSKVDTNKLPYFIKSLNIEASIELVKTNYNLNYSTGYMGNDPDRQIGIVGDKGTKITYNFDNLFDSTNKSVVKEALNTISKYTNIIFEELSNSQTADIKYTFENTGYVIDSGGTLGSTWIGDPIIKLSKEAYYTGGNLDSYGGYLTVIHETLHSLGAEHTFDGKFGNYTKGGLLGSDSILEQYEDIVGFSVMSYTRNDFNGARDLRLYDLAYLHYRFGVNMKERAGNDIYTFKDFNQSSADGDIYIWDGDGVDTFDASKESQNVYVDLTPGSWIYSGTKANKLGAIGFHGYSIKDFFGLLGTARVEYDDMLSGKYRNVLSVAPVNFTDKQAFIGYDTQIENVIGGSGDDKLFGNKANNAIYGGAGVDTIDGREGNDYIDGGLGADSMTGGKGDDIFVVDNVGDTVIEKSGADEGTDSVYSTINIDKLFDNVENLVLLGSALNGTGNELGNIIIGNNQNNTLNGGDGNDRLEGMGGSDILIGGSGADNFVFNTPLDGSVDTIQDFELSKDKIVLDKSIFSKLTSISMPDWNDYIQYDKKTGHLYYDSDGKGDADAIHFVTIANKDIDLDSNQFVIA